MSPIQALVFDLDKFFFGGNHWQAGLHQQIDGLTLEQVLWKPSPERHCIWECLLHINFWKQYAIASAKGTERPDADSGNWSLPPRTPTTDMWQAEITRSISLHEELKTATEALGEEVLNTENRISNYLRQIVGHDAYHTGQIGILRAMQGIPPVE